METIFKPNPQKGFSRNNEGEAVYQLLPDNYQDFQKIHVTIRTSGFIRSETAQMTEEQRELKLFIFID